MEPREEQNRRPSNAMIIVIALALALLLLLTAVSVVFLTKPHTSEKGPPFVLRIGSMEIVDSLNPFVGASDSSSLLYSLLYDSLTCVNEDLEVSPSLALGSWAVPTTDPKLVESGEPYGSVWQYNLTRNAVWSDGQPFTADDVVWNINLNAMNYSSLWAYQPTMYFAHYAEKVDDYTVRVHFYDRATQEPKAAAYAYSLQMYMLPRHKMRDMTASYIGYKWTGVFSGDAMPIVGTGPFMANASIYDQWVNSDVITLERNPSYFWKTEYGKDIEIDQIKLTFYDDPLAMQLAMRNGELDIAEFPAQTYRSIEKDIVEGKLRGVGTYDGPKIASYWTGIGICDKPNSKNPSRLDPVIKHAMALATNRSYIAANFYLGLAEVGSTTVGPAGSFWHYEPTSAEELSYDLDAARSLLNASGYVDVNSDLIREATADSFAVKSGYVSPGTQLKYEMLLTVGHPEEKDTANWLKTEWAQIGIEVTVLMIDPNAMPLNWERYEYDLEIATLSSEIDPNSQLFSFTSTSINGWNDVWYHSSAFDKNYSNSVSSMNETVRKGYVDNCQRIMYNDSACIVMVYPYQTYAWRTDTMTGLGDWFAHPGRSLDNVWTANPVLFDLREDLPVHSSGL